MTRAAECRRVAVLVAALAAASWRPAPVRPQPAGQEAQHAERGLAGVRGGAQPFSARLALRHAGAAGALEVRAAQSARTPLLVVRDWLPVGAVALALPVPAAPASAARAADLALLGALREAAGGLAARVEAVRTRTARCFVATALPEDLADLYAVMRRVAAGPLPQRHVEAAAARTGRAREFRQGSPHDRFEQLFAAHLAGTDRGAVRHPGPGAAGAATRADSAGPGASAATRPAALDAVSRAPATAWGDPAWVVVADRARPGLPAPPAGGDGAPPADARPFVLPRGSAETPAPGELASIREPAEVVTTWLGLAFEFAPGTTLQQADLARTLLAMRVGRRQDDAVYSFSAELGPAGRLLVELSASPEAAGAWEARIAEMLAAPTLEDPGPGPAALLRAARSRQSQAIADPAVAATTAADALIRGASPVQALARAGGETAPLAQDIAGVVRAPRLVLRVEYGAPAR